MVYYFQHNQMIRQRICCTLSLGGKCSVTTCISVKVPRSCLDTGTEKMCSSSNPQGTAGTATVLVERVSPAVGRREDGALCAFAAK